MKNVIIAFDFLPCSQWDGDMAFTLLCQDGILHEKTSNVRLFSYSGNKLCLVIMRVC